MNVPTAGKQIVDRARDRGIHAACCTWLHSSCGACTTVDLEIFVLENFRVLNFRVKIFSWFRIPTKNF